MTGLAALLLGGVASAQSSRPAVPRDQWAAPSSSSYSSLPAQPLPAVAASLLPEKPPPSPSATQRVVYQRANDPASPYSDDALENLIQLNPPGPDRLFRLESEASLMERMKQQGLERVPPERLEFPDEPVLSTETYAGRNWPERDELVEPNYLCYGKLLFEDRNSERYGWDLGPIQVPLSNLLFFVDSACVPYNLGKDPCRTEVSAGYCLPGDPVPYLLYPPEMSVTGTIAEAGVAVTLFAIFP